MAILKSNNENWFEDGESTRSTSPKEQETQGVEEERRSNPGHNQISPAPFPEPRPLSDSRLQQFKDTFARFTWLLDKEKISHVVKQINTWNSNTGLYFSDKQAVYALQDLERRGEIRLHGDMIFFPEAFHLIPVKVEVTNERGGLTHTSNMSRE